MVQIGRSCGWQLRLIRMLIASGAIALSSDHVFAQNITLDGTLGTEGTLTGPNYTIPQSVGLTAGSNLFHSFGQFSLIRGETANFQSAATILNILARVTGGTRSSIDGLIRTESRNVNLFLINPSGIIFGLNAQLSIGSATRGSFVATTLDAVVLPNGTQFSATNLGGTSSLLTVVGDPSGFLASQRTPASIQSTRSNLRVGNGQSLVLLGGDVSLEGGRLDAPGGRVDVGSAAADSQVKLIIDNNALSLGFPANTARAGQFLANRTTFSVVNPNGGNAGVGINAGFINLVGSNILSSTSGAGSAGSIHLQASNSVELRNSRITSSTSDSNAGGNIEILSEKLFSLTDSTLTAQTLGQGNAGNILIRTDGAVSISGGSISTSSGAPTRDTSGNAGSISIYAGELSLTDDTRLSTATTSAGRGGDIIFTTASGSLNIVNSEVRTRTNSSGDAGIITIAAADSVNVSGILPSGFLGGLFTRTDGSGKAGDITVTATNTVRILNGAVLDARTIANGEGGSISVTAKTVEVSNGGQILTTTQGSNQAGNITLKVQDRLTLAGERSGLFANTDPGSSGSGGSIVIDPRTATIRDAARIAVSSEGSGTGGNIQIQAGRITLDTGGLISAETNSSQGGNITLNVQDLLLLRRGSSISATAGRTQDGGDGGNIRIFAPNGFIVAAPNENSDITANAFTGSGGRVTISAQKIFWLVPRSRADLERLLGGPPLDPRRLPTNDITAISQENPNLSGEVTINTPDVDPNRGLVPLPVNLVDPSGLIAQECSPTNKQASSSFVVTGQGGLPPNPTGVLGGEAVITRLATLKDRQPEQSTQVQPASTAAQPASEIVEATGWVVGPDGVVTLVAEAPNAAPAASWAVPPACQR